LSRAEIDICEAQGYKLQFIALRSNTLRWGEKKEIYIQVGNCEKSKVRKRTEDPEASTTHADQRSCQQGKELTRKHSTLSNIETERKDEQTERRWPGL
jgi:hypothetical protein